MTPPQTWPITWATAPLPWMTSGMPGYFAFMRSRPIPVEAGPKTAPDANRTQSGRLRSYCAPSLAAPFRPSPRAVAVQRSGLPTYISAATGRARTARRTVLPRPSLLSCATPGDGVAAPTEQEAALSDAPPLPRSRLFAHRGHRQLPAANGADQQGHRGEDRHVRRVDLLAHGHSQPSRRGRDARRPPTSPCRRPCGRWPPQASWRTTST